MLMGAVKVAITLIGRLNPHLRKVEDELPDAVLIQSDSLGHAEA